MQGLPFDDSDFNPSSVPGASAWMESSAPQLTNQPNFSSVVTTPLLPPPHHNPSIHSHLPPANVSDEDLYRIVSAASSGADHISPSPHLLPTNASSNPSPYPHPFNSAHVSDPRHSLHHQPYTQPPQLKSLSVNPQSAHQIPHQSHFSNPSISPGMPRNSYPSVSAQFHPNVTKAQGLTRSNPLPMQSIVVDPRQHSEGHPQPQRPLSSRRPSTGSQNTASSIPPHVGLPLLSPRDPSASADTKRRPRVLRSAVEEARLRAQQEAESYAHNRKDGVKREPISISSASGTTIQGGSPGSAGGAPAQAAASTIGTDRCRIIKRQRTDLTSAPHREGSVDRHENIANAAMDDSEAEKQERYKRRLDMNRESAAVSRVRRRAYVKELEERLAAVEAEKFQLEGKLEIMMTQNESFKRQLENLFMMVASGQRPVFTDGVRQLPTENPEHTLEENVGLPINADFSSSVADQDNGGNAVRGQMRSQGPHSS